MFAIASHARIAPEREAFFIEDSRRAGSWSRFVLDRDVVRGLAGRVRIRALHAYDRLATRWHGRTDLLLRTLLALVRDHDRLTIDEQFRNRIEVARGVRGRGGGPGPAGRGAGDITRRPLR